MVTFLVIYLLTILSALSQTISGIVKDQENNPIEFANVILSLKGEQREVMAVSTTDSIGYYEFLDLKPDIYLLEVSVIGFNGITSNAIKFEKEAIKIKVSKGFGKELTCEISKTSMFEIREQSNWLDTKSFFVG